MNSGIAERFSAILPNSVILSIITEQASAISIVRGKNDHDQRSSGTVFRYPPEFRYTLDHNGTGFRYLDRSG
jgi:hypothetical protein